MNEQLVSKKVLQNKVHKHFSVDQIEGHTTEFIKLYSRRLFPTIDSGNEPTHTRRLPLKLMTRGLNHVYVLLKDII